MKATPYWRRPHWKRGDLAAIVRTLDVTVIVHMQQLGHAASARVYQLAAYVEDALEARPAHLPAPYAVSADGDMLSLETIHGTESEIAQAQGAAAEALTACGWQPCAAKPAGDGP
ncbi:MAG TPA: hypothetical protein VFL90_06290 [Methylomirabilota bacterium]|nr:hypothetical protein [Methylomirabilota bacterium]